MFSWIRQKFGPVVVTLIVGGIASIFILTDFLSPRAERGMGRVAGGEAGSVNGEVISAGDFHREVSRRMESFRQMSGGKLSDEQLKMLRVEERVFEELVQRRLVLQDCRKSGTIATDAEVRARIQEMPPFQKNGKFDRATYESLLAGNGLSPGKFEEMIREDLTVQRWTDLVRSRVRVSENEIHREFRAANEKRNIKYVVLDLEAGRRAVRVAPSDIDAFVKDEQKLARAKSKYEQERETRFKAKKFDEVRRDIVRDILAGERIDEARKAYQKLADQIVPLLGQGPDSRVQALLGPVGVSVKSSGMISMDGARLEGITDPHALLGDAFADKSPILLTTGGKARKYESAGWVAVAAVTEVKKPDLSKLAGESPKLEQRIRARKERELEEEWIRSLRDRARIKLNAKVVNPPEADAG